MKRVVVIGVLLAGLWIGVGAAAARGPELLLPQGETLAAGDNHFVLVRPDGSVWAWGAGAAGQLGGKRIDNAGKLLRVVGTGQTTAVAAGRTYSAAVQADGSFRIWGSFNGQTLLSPTRVDALDGTIALAEGRDHTLALQQDGTVRSWGSNKRGQLGIPGDADTVLADAGSVPGLDSMVSIAAGDYHSVALRKDGSVWTWGDGMAGQLGNGQEQDESAPARVAGIKNATMVTAGAFHTAVLLADGTVWTWGYSAHGELGNGKDIGSLKPVQVSGLTDIVEIAAGRYHMVALKRDGTVWTWGANGYGQIGTNVKNDVMKPVQVIGIGPAVAVVAGEYDTAALLVDGSVEAWGFGAYGQLGDGKYQMHASPVTVLGLDGGAKVAGPGLGSVIKVTIDGVPQSYEQPPVLVNEHTMVPLRGIFEALGATVEWNNDERSVTATKGGTIVYFRIGDSAAQVNGEETDLDQPAIIVNEHTMVPIRFVGEALGAGVTWLGDSRTVAIATK